MEITGKACIALSSYKAIIITPPTCGANILSLLF
jgi:hypothetical protein